MQHRHKKNHHDSEQQAGPADLNSCGNAQGRGDQREANEIGPEQTPGHIRGNHGLEALRSGEVQGAEDRQGEGETQIAQGHDLVEAAGLPDIGLRSPRGNHEKHDAGAAHRDYGARDLEKGCKNG